MVGDVLGQIDVADELHRQRRTALQGLAAVQYVLDGCAQEPHVVDPAVLVEAPVLGRDRRLSELPWDLAAGNVGAEHDGRDVAQALAVGGVHDGNLSRDVWLQVIEVRSRVGGCHHPADDTDGTHYGCGEKREPDDDQHP